MRKCYIRKYNDNKLYVDIYSTYRIVVLESKGINDTPDRKDPFIEDWVDRNGIKVLESVSSVFKPIKCKFKFALLGDNATMRNNFKTFWAELIRVIPTIHGGGIGSSVMEYYDTDMGLSRAKKIRLTSGLNDLEFTQENITDVQNPKVLVSAITFQAEFSIDQPDINSY